jgi:DNA primase
MNDNFLIEQIKERLTIQEAAEAYTSIDFSRVRGSRNTINVKCPFHEDRSPSFTIWLDSNRWKCHAGCGYGDVIDLYAIAHQVEVKEAIKLLADKFGLTDNPLDQKKASELSKRAEAREAERRMVQDFNKRFDDVFRRLLNLELMIEDRLNQIKTMSDLEILGELYHVRDYVGYLLDCMVNERMEEQIEAFKRANEVLVKWQV